MPNRPLNEEKAAPEGAAELNARQRSQQETRQRLLASAIGLYGKNSGKNTTIKQLAAHAGVAVGTVYLHFKDRDALLHEVLKLAMTRLRQELGKYAEPGAVGPDLVASKMEGLVSFTEHHPELAGLLFSPGNLATGPGHEALDFLTRSQENGLLSGIAEGYYRGDLNSTLTSRALVGILIHTLGWWARNPEAASRDEVLRVLIELRMNGLKTLS